MIQLPMTLLYAKNNSWKRETLVLLFNMHNMRTRNTWLNHIRHLYFSLLILHVFNFLNFISELKPWRMGRSRFFDSCASLGKRSLRPHQLQPAHCLKMPMICKWLESVVYWLSWKPSLFYCFLIFVPDNDIHDIPIFQHILAL